MSLANFVRASVPITTLSGQSDLIVGLSVPYDAKLVPNTGRPDAYATAEFVSPGVARVSVFTIGKTFASTPWDGLTEPITVDLVFLWGATESGELDDLITQDKTSFVAAINEVSAKASANQSRINQERLRATAAENNLMQRKLEANAFNANAVFVMVKELGGVGSGLDADLLDGRHASEFADQEALGGKVDKVPGMALSTNDYTNSDKAKLGAIEPGATADQTPAEILEAIKSVDGHVSGLDADLLDGKHASEFATFAQGELAESAVQPSALASALALKLDKDNNYNPAGTGLASNTLGGAVTELKGLIDSLNDVYSTDAETAATIAQINAAWQGADSELTVVLAGKLDSAIYTAQDILAKLLTVAGTGSGLDADKLDGKHASEFATADQGSKADTAIQQAALDTALLAKVDKVPGKALSTEDYTTAEKQKLANISEGAAPNQTPTELLASLTTVDGVGSGLDADLLDGKHASEFATAAQGAKADTAIQPGELDTALLSKVDKIAGKGLSTEDYTSDEKTKLDGVEAGATADQTPAEILAALTTVDGSDSGLDADLLDGKHASEFIAVGDVIDCGEL